MNYNDLSSKLAQVIEQIPKDVLYDFCCSYAQEHEELAMALVNEFWRPEKDDYRSMVQQCLMQTEMAGKYETGGYLIGQCNLKTNTIHVVDTIEAPEDTIHRGDYLVLGKAGVKKKLSQIERRSGATFGYVGEWHSHPNGPCGFSATDFEEFANKAEDMKADGAAKPILEVLVSPVGLTCAVLSLC